MLLEEELVDLAGDLKRCYREQINTDAKNKGRKYEKGEHRPLCWMNRRKLVRIYAYFHYLADGLNFLLWDDAEIRRASGVQVNDSPELNADETATEEAKEIRLEKRPEFESDEAVKCKPNNDSARPLQKAFVEGIQLQIQFVLSELEGFVHSYNWPNYEHQLAWFGLTIASRDTDREEYQNTEKLGELRSGIRSRIEVNQIGNLFYFVFTQVLRCPAPPIFLKIYDFY